MALTGGTGYDKDYESDTDDIEYKSRHSKKLSLPPDVHLPNKNEAKLLRKLMSETGLTEKQIRSIYKYRRMLSEESKKKGIKNVFERNLVNHLKTITKEFKVRRNHPSVVNKLLKEIEEVRLNTPNAKTSLYDGSRFMLKISSDEWIKKYLKLE